MLAELAEADAKGRIAEIYDEIKYLWAVPYVSSVYKHMATRPGLLEWAWAEVAPVFRDGSAQEAAWRTAADFNLAEVAPVPRDALRVWGVDAHAEATIRGLCEGFACVSPVNLVFAGMKQEEHRRGIQRIALLVDLLDRIACQAHTDRAQVFIGPVG